MSLNIKIKIKKFSDLVVLANVYICTAIVRTYFNSTVRRKDWSMFGYLRQNESSQNHKCPCKLIFIVA